MSPTREGVFGSALRSHIPWVVLRSYTLVLAHLARPCGRTKKVVNLTYKEHFPGVKVQTEDLHLET